MLQKIAVLCFSVVLLLPSCVWKQKIKDGETAYDRKQYAVAITLLEKELEAESNVKIKGRKNYLLANAYSRLLQYRESLQAYKEAAQAGYGPEALAGQARTHKVLEEYSEAVGVYRKLAEQAGKKQEAERDIMLCLQAAEAKKKKTEYQIEKVIENSSVSDYAPVLFEDRFLVFTSERKDATGKDVYKWTGERFTDLFIIPKSGSGAEAQKFDAALNTPDNEGTAWFTKSMQRVYFTRCTGADDEDDHCKLFYSDRINGIWSEPEPLPFMLPGINYGQPTLIENDSVLVFSSDLAEAGGPRDLYYSELFSDGLWSAPEAMPATINSSGNELFPTGDKDTLYFSSDFLPGMGGFDIFKSFLRSDGSWSPAENMGYPINSGADDFSFIVDYNAKPRPRIVQQGFFVSSRDQAGKDDLYRFARLEPVNSPLNQDSIARSKQKKDLFLVVRSYESTYSIADDPNSGLTGKKPLGNTRISLLQDGNAQSTDNGSDPNGFFFMEVSHTGHYTIRVSRPGYLSATLTFHAPEVEFKPSETSLTINKEVVLEKIYPLKEINLQNIYYDFDSWEILEAAKPSLNKLAKILQDNPKIRIQLTSHTDCRGDDAYNLALSQRRAQSAIDYLVSVGIDVSRMEAVGMGETALVERCPCETCTEEQHQSNRRTAFIILAN